MRDEIDCWNDDARILKKMNHKMMIVSSVWCCRLFQKKNIHVLHSNETNNVSKDKYSESTW